MEGLVPRHIRPNVRDVRGNEGLARYDDNRRSLLSWRTDTVSQKDDSSESETGSRQVASSDFLYVFCQRADAGLGVKR